eukprot:scaffold9957_cov107-Isochrysis_galbana.AAC.3
MRPGTSRSGGAGARQKRMCAGNLSSHQPGQGTRGLLSGRSGTEAHLDRRAVGADDDGGGVAAHTHQFDRLVDCDLLKVDARTDQDAVVRLAAEHRRIDGAEDAGLAAAGIDHQRRPARRRRQRDGAHDVERKPTQLLLHYVPRAGAGGGGGAAQRRGDGSRSEIGQGCGASRQRAPSRAPRPPKLELLLP